MRRIVSLVPSLSETIAKVGRIEEIVGVTKFCSRPANLMKNAMIVGGTKDPDLQLISGLNPTHILVNLEENQPRDIEWLNVRFPTLITRPSSVLETVEMFADLASFLADEKYLFQSQLLSSMVGKFKKKSRLHPAFYFIWKNPWMLAGENTYIKDVMSFLGYELIQPREGRYPHINLDELKNNSHLFFSTEPWPFRKRDLEPFVSSGISHDLYKIDGRLTSWYGQTSIELFQMMDEGKYDRIYWGF